MPPSESIPSDLNTSEEEREYERQYARYLRKLDRYNRKQAEIRYVSEREEAQRRVHAIQNKRDQWKAASARYYERHPEVKEKKRLQAAEKRAAKKLARRRWDPPKKIKVLVEDDLDSGITQRLGPPLPPRHRRTREEQQLGNFSDTPDIDLIPDALHARAGPYTHDDILQLWTEEEAESGGHAVDILSPQAETREPPPIWASLAPEYESSDDEAASAGTLK
ncbi:hypothetical protein B0H14DRAFT_2609478 [Mycena olivaceomarginata]|nr:hypothetical protein B0H14DRAFT_2609478 [Mycena olivaceomarginata]